MAATETTLSSVLVLDAARDAVKLESAAIIRKLEMAIEWVLLHPGDEVDTSIEWGMRDLEIAGDGAPSIDEGAVAEFALAIGASTDSGRDFLGDAVELAFRLPRVWAKVVAGEVPAWKARRAAEERRKAAAEQRHVDVHLDQVSPDGLVHIDADADVDHADALAFNDLIASKASDLDPMLPLDVRRAMALGTLDAGGDGADGAGVQREIVIYAHTRPDQAMVDVENTRTVITPEHLRDWCQQAGTRVTVRPVIDLNAELSTDVHDPTETMKEQARLRHRTCVFPHCGRPARGCDLDHILEWPPGRTTTINLGPLCRRHHRLKTHTDWTYTPLGRDGTRITFEWTDPSGRRHIS